MPIINKTITQASLDLNSLNAQILELQNKIDSLDSTQLNKAKIYNNETERDLDNPNPTNDDWCYVTSSENTSYLGLVVLYKYSDSWTVITSINYINDATTSSKGILQLSGDLTGTASSPQLKSILVGGTYAFGNNTVTVNSKGLISNIINATASYEWIYYSNQTTNPRSIDTKTLTVPSYNVASANILFFYNGSIIPEPNNFTRFSPTTITTAFTVKKTDDIMIINLKFIGSINSSAIMNDLAQDTTTTYSSNKLENDFAKLTSDIVPDTTDIYKIGDSTHKYSDIYLVNAPTVLSDPQHKRNIESLNINALEFVNSLESYQYQLLDSGKRTHTGLLTTQLKATLDSFGVDYAMYVKDFENNEEAIRYEELISVLIKAVSQNTPLYKKILYKIKKFIRERKCKND